MVWRSLSPMPRVAAVCLAAVSLLIGVGVTVGALITAVKNYAPSIDAGYETIPILSVADEAPMTGDPTKEYQMIGFPDGLGAHPNGDGRFTLYMNHELTSGTLSQPVVGGTRNRGAFVSKYIVHPKTGVVSGTRAHDTVYLDDALVGPAAEEDGQLLFLVPKR